MGKGKILAMLLAVSMVFCTIVVLPLSAVVAEFDSDKGAATYKAQYSQTFSDRWDASAFYSQWNTIDANFTADNVTGGALTLNWVPKRVMCSKVAYDTPYVFESDLEYGFMADGSSYNGSGMIIRADGISEALQDYNSGDITTYNEEGIAIFPSKDKTKMYVQFTGPRNVVNPNTGKVDPTLTTAKRIALPLPTGVTNAMSRAVMRIEDFGTSIYVYYNDAPYFRIDLDVNSIIDNKYTAGTVYNADMQVIDTFANMEVEVKGHVAFAERCAGLKVYRATVKYNNAMVADKPAATYENSYEQTFTSFDSTKFYGMWDVVDTFDASDVIDGSLKFSWIPRRIISSKAVYKAPYIYEMDFETVSLGCLGAAVIRVSPTMNHDDLQEPASSNNYNREGVAIFPSLDGSQMYVQFSGAFDATNDTTKKATTITRIQVPAPAGVSLKARAKLRIEDFGTSIYVYYANSPYLRIDLSGKVGSVYTSGTVYNSKMEVAGTFTNMEVEEAGEVAVAIRGGSTHDTINLYSIKVNWNPDPLVVARKALAPKIRDAQLIVPSEYTAASYEASNLATVISNAQSAYNNTGATVQELQDAIAAINSAMAQLVYSTDYALVLNQVFANQSIADITNNWNLEGTDPTNLGVTPIDGEGITIGAATWTARFDIRSKYAFEDYEMAATIKTKNNNKSALMLRQYPGSDVVEGDQLSPERQGFIGAAINFSNPTKVDLTLRTGACQGAARVFIPDMDLPAGTNLNNGAAIKVKDNGDTIKFYVSGTLIFTIALDHSSIVTGSIRVGSGDSGIRQNVSYYTSGKVTVAATGVETPFTGCVIPALDSVTNSGHFAFAERTGVLAIRNLKIWVPKDEQPVYNNLTEVYNESFDTALTQEQANSRFIVPFTANNFMFSGNGYARIRWSYDNNQYPAGNGTVLATQRSYQNYKLETTVNVPSADLHAAIGLRNPCISKTIPNGEGTYEFSTIDEMREGSVREGGIAERPGTEGIILMLDGIQLADNEFAIVFKDGTPAQIRIPNDPVVYRDAQKAEYVLKYPAGVNIKNDTDIVIYDMDNVVYIYIAGRLAARIELSDLVNDVYTGGSVYDGENNIVGAPFSGMVVARSGRIVYGTRTSSMDIASIKISEKIAAGTFIDGAKVVGNNIYVDLSSDVAIDQSKLILALYSADGELVYVKIADAAITPGYMSRTFEELPEDWAYMKVMLIDSMSSLKPITSPVQLEL